MVMQFCGVDRPTVENAEAIYDVDSNIFGNWGRAVARAAPGGRADIRVLPPEYEWTGPLGLDGPHQRRNAGVAHGILMALPAPYRPGPEAVAPPGSRDGWTGGASGCSTSPTIPTASGR